jgi:pyruvate dehydrogenase kinase 2/3/4
LPSGHSTEDLFSFSHTRNSSRLEGSRLGALKSATSRTRGLLGTLKEQIDLKPETAASHPQLGIGLPMSNIYAK